MLRTPERAAKLQYAAHYWQLETNRVLFRADRKAAVAAFITPDGRLDLAAMLADTQLNGVYVARRSYTAAIDNFVKARSDQPDRLIAVSSSDSAFRMLELGRADYTFGYDYELNYFNARQKQPLDLDAIAATGDRLYVEGGIACSQGPISARVIAALDDLLDRQPTTPLVDKAERRWHGALPENPRSAVTN
jgi:uncharacterized protein (TIGR02285 family)